ncbi:MAG: EamA family transporter, partial [Flavobacteriaceae bacterium]|nr:EamA family transporter [Flavobacteriaceae bacterium]
MQTNNLKNYLHLHLIVFIWGFTAILGALISIDAIPLVWYRMLLASIFILMYFLFKKKSLKIDGRIALKFLFGGLIIALHWITFFGAIKVSNVSVALVTLSTGALFTSFLEPIFFKRKVNYIEILFGLIVVFGLYLIFKVETEYWLGIILALIAAFLSASFSVLNGLYVQKYEPATISFYQILFGVLAITIYFLFNGNFTVEFFQLKPTDWLYLLILSSVCTAYAFIVSVKLLRYLSPYTIMLTINLEPVYGILLAVLIFGEKEMMDSMFYVGALIILFTVLANG